MDSKFFIINFPENLITWFQPLQRFRGAACLQEANAQIRSARRISEVSVRRTSSRHIFALRTPFGKGIHDQVICRRSIILSLQRCIALTFNKGTTTQEENTQNLI